MSQFDQETLHKQVLDILEPVLEEEQMELVDVNLQLLKKSGLLKIVIDKPGGVSIGDCQTISKRLNYLLDVEKVPLKSYRLEISSPGIFCDLKREADFKRNKGKRILVQFTASDDRSKTLHGTLGDYNGEFLTLLDEGGSQVNIENTRISKARLDPLLFPKMHQGRAKAKRGKKWVGK